MKRFHRPRMLIGVFGLALWLSGCGADNQEQSRIQGTLPTDSLTPEQRYSQQAAGKTSAYEGSKPYPGASRKSK